MCCICCITEQSHTTDFSNYTRCQACHHIFKMTLSPTFTPLTDCTFHHVSCVSEDKTVDSGTYFTLHDVFNASLKPTSYSLNWISGQSKTLTGQEDAPRNFPAFGAITLTFIETPILLIDIGGC